MAQKRFSTYKKIFLNNKTLLSKDEKKSFESRVFICLITSAIRDGEPVPYGKFGCSAFS